MAGDRLPSRRFRQAFVDAPFFLPDLKAWAIQDRDPGTVIAAIFQTAQSFQNDRSRFFLSNVTNNAAHGVKIGEFGSDATCFFNSEKGIKRKLARKKGIG